ncbi:Nuclear pore complex protein Nup50 [Homalodisca vitripennis]|nr:Nuclear pore complex protein Nup50 [Homalodisca vitripennis]
MAKRTASSDINHDNWDAPFVPEEAGSFKIAAQAALQKRVIKTAKRRIKTSESSDAGKSLFASFGGFKPNAASQGSDTSKTFSFLSSGPVTTSSNTSMPTNGTKFVTPQPRFEMTNSNIPSVNRPQQKYLSDLKELNQSVVAWIKKHVESDSHCILSPVFEDYNNMQQRRSQTTATTTRSQPTCYSPSCCSLSPNLIDMPIFLKIWTLVDSVERNPTDNRCHCRVPGHCTLAEPQLRIFPERTNPKIAVLSHQSTLSI